MPGVPSSTLNIREEQGPCAYICSNMATEPWRAHIARTGCHAAVAPRLQRRLVLLAARALSATVSAWQAGTTRPTASTRKLSCGTPCFTSTSEHSKLRTARGRGAVNTSAHAAWQPVRVHVLHCAFLEVRLAAASPALCFWYAFGTPNAVQLPPASMYMRSSAPYSYACA